MHVQIAAVAKKLGPHFDAIAKLSRPEDPRDMKSEEIGEKVIKDEPHVTMDVPLHVKKERIEEVLRLGAEAANISAELKAYGELLLAICSSYC